ncbi:putative nickel-responsive regulator [Bacteroidia bacterium]|nr:putative nickel-responsive regulator [Bacteroidia bacterium]
MAISRFSVSLASDLLEALDGYVVANKFPNRSQAIRNLIERNLVEKKWQCNNVVAGAVVLVYDYRVGDIASKMTEIYRYYQGEILAIQQFPLLQDDTYFEVLSVRGKSYRLTELADLLISLKGVRHGKLIMTHCECRKGGKRAKK